MKKILIDNKIPFIKGALEPFAQVEYIAPSEFSNQIVKDADALIIRTRTKCNQQLLKDSSVKIIATATIGFDHIDISYCDANNIKWVNAPGCNSSSVQQYIASVLLALAAQKNIELNEKTIGIVGVGNVGSKIKLLCQSLGMKVILNDPPRQRRELRDEFVNMDILIKESDIITFHVPLNVDGADKTLHLADESFFEKLDGSKIVINSSRGEVVKTSALKNAIKNGKVEACVLDVWENEPEIDLELLNLVDIATPHIAGYSVEGKANGTAVCVNEVSSFLNLEVPSNWYPKDLPSPSNLLNVNSISKSNQEVITDLVLSVYNVLNDYNLLLSSPDTFEKQRGLYPPRREFTYYSVEGVLDEELKLKLQKIGFAVPL